MSLTLRLSVFLVLFLIIPMRSSSPASEPNPAIARLVAAAREATPRRMLESLPADVREARRATVERALATLPACGETLLLALLGERFLAGDAENPARSFGPLDPAPGQNAYSGRSLGAAGFQERLASLSVLGGTYEPISTLYTSPLILDLDGDGAPDVEAGSWAPHVGLDLSGARLVPFDINGDGFEELTEWPGPRDALLVDPEDSAKIVRGAGGLAWEGRLSGRDLAGTAEGYRDGFQKLALRRDLDGDGVVAGAEIDGLYLWRDADGDARIGAGEIESAAAMKVTAIRLPKEEPAGLFEREGRTGLVWDWWPSYALARKLAPAGTSAGSPSPIGLAARHLPDAPAPVRVLPIDAAGRVARTDLLAAGIDGDTVTLVRVSPDGSLVVLQDATSDPADVAAGAARRLWVFFREKEEMAVRKILLPAASIQQLVFETADSALVAADNGAIHFRVDLARGDRAALDPPPAGPMFRSGTLAWRAGLDVFIAGDFHNARTEAMGRAIVRVLRDGEAALLHPDADLDGIEAAARKLGPIAMRVHVTPSLSFFVVRTGEGAFALVAVREGEPSIVDPSVGLGGIAASGTRILYARVDPERRTQEQVVRDVATGETFVLGEGEYAYPYLEAEGRLAIVAHIDWPSGSMSFLSATVRRGARLRPFLRTAGIGALRVSDDGTTYAFLGPEGLIVGPTGKDAPFTRGDANGDRRIDVGDAVRMLEVLFFGAPLLCEKALDGNDDGSLDIADAMHVLAYLFARGEAPPRPFPRCGADPTPDPLTCWARAMCYD